MANLDPYIYGTLGVILFSLFWIGLYGLRGRLNLAAKGFEVKPLFLMWRTERLNNTLDRVAQRFPNAVLVFSNVSVVLGVGMIIFVSYSLIKNLLAFSLSPAEALPILPVIPLVTLKLESIPYFLLAAAIILVIHEGAHGVVARRENLKVKSTGLVLLGLIPGAFVEPDEESFKKAETKKRVRVLAAGSSSNLIFGLILLVLLLLLFPPTGVLVSGLVEDGPASKAGIEPGSVITAINGTSIPSRNALSNYMGRVEPGTTLVLTVEFRNGTQRLIQIVTIASTTEQGRALIGIYPQDFIEATPYFQGIFWIQFWSINIAVVNMLPFYPLDGEGFVGALVERLSKKHARQVRSLVSSFFLGLLAANMLLTFINFGLISI